MRTALGSRMIPAGFCLLFLLALPLTAGPITNFYSIDYPGAIRTDAYKVNDYHQVVGAYQDAGGAFHGYIFDYGHQTFTPLDFPRSNRTLAYGINDNGEVSGYYRDSGNVVHGFRYSGGVWTSIDFPGSTRTFIYGDASDSLVGRYRDSNMVFHPFICTRNSGCSAWPDYPGASSTVPYAINDSGTSVGYWADSTGSVYNGYSYDGSTFALGAYPGALATFAEGINNSGDVVGAWGGTDTLYHGFLYRGGVY